MRNDIFPLSGVLGDDVAQRSLIGRLSKQNWWTKDSSRLLCEVAAAEGTVRIKGF